MHNHLMASGFVISLWIVMQAHGHDSAFRWELGGLLLLAGAFLWQCFGAYKRNIQLPLYGSLISYSLFLVWCVLSVFWSIVPADSVLMVMTFSLALLAMILAYAGNQQQEQWADHSLAVLGCLVAGFMFHQSFSLGAPRPNAWFINPNTAAAFLSLILVPLCARYLERATVYRSVLIFVLCLAICLTQGRGVLLGLLIAVSLLGYVAWQAKKSAAMKEVLLYLLLAYLCANFLQVWVLDQGSAIGRMGATSGVDTARLLLWKEGWAMYLQRPFLGWGLGQFHWLHASHRDPFSTNPGMFVHNDLFQFLIELGPVGLVLSLWFVWKLVSTAYRLYRQQKQSNTIDLYALGLLAACLGMFTHTMLTFNLYQSPMLLLMGWYVGILSRRNVEAQVETVVYFTPADHIGRAAYVSFFSMISIALVIWLCSLFFAFRALDLSFNKIQPIQAFNHLRKATEFNSLIDEFHVRQAVLILDLLKIDADKLKGAEKDNFIAYGLERVNIGIGKHPYRSISYLTRAELLLHLEKTDDARASLYQALKVNPYDLEARLLLAQLLASVSDTESQNVLRDGFGRLYNKIQHQDAINFLMYAYRNLTLQEQGHVKQQIDKIAALMMKQSKYLRPYILDDFVTNKDESDIRKAASRMI